MAAWPWEHENNGSDRKSCGSQQPSCRGLRGIRSRSEGMSFGRKPAGLPHSGKAFLQSTAAN